MIPNFVYESNTPDHALKPVVILPELTRQLKAYCVSNKCKPVEVLEAIYDFQKSNGLNVTFNHVVIRCVKGKSPAKGKDSIGYLIKHTDFAWVFGIPQAEDEYRVC